MRRSLLFILLPGLLLPSLSMAQDIHFSQFRFAPANLNPALTGAFDGNYRFIANQRTQWRSVTVPYSTFGIAADARAPQGVEGLGIGAHFFHDVAGDSRLRTIQTGLSGSWRFKLDADSTHFLSVGISPRFEQRSIDYEELQFDNQYNGVRFDPGRSTGENFSRELRNYVDANVGVQYEHRDEKGQHYRGGVAFFNLFKAEQSFYEEAWVQRDRRMTLFAEADRSLRDDIRLQPAAFLGMQGSYHELIVGSEGEFILMDELGKYRSVFAGLWYRTRDAGFITAGMKYDEWRVGVSYDVNLSELQPASQGRGAFEFSLRYILREYERPDEPHKTCPVFI